MIQVMSCVEDYRLLANIIYTSSIQHPASSIQYPVSSIQHLSSILRCKWHKKCSAIIPRECSRAKNDYRYEMVTDKIHVITGLFCYHLCSNCLMQRQKV